MQLFFRPDDWTPTMMVANRKFPDISLSLYIYIHIYIYIYFQLPCWFSGDVYKNTLYHNHIFGFQKSCYATCGNFIKSRRTLIMLKHVQVGKFGGCFFQSLKSMGCVLEHFKYPLRKLTNVDLKRDHFKRK